MRSITLVVISFLLLSCGIVNKKESVVPEDNESDQIKTTITGSVVILRHDGSEHPYGNSFGKVGIIDENGVTYAIHPREKDEEFRNRRNRLYDFEVIMLNEPKYKGYDKTVTLVNWKTHTIERTPPYLIPPQPPPPIPLYYDHYVINENGTVGTLKDHKYTKETVTITGKIPRGGYLPGMIICDKMIYYSYPSRIANDIDRLSGHLVKFNVIIYDEPVLEGGRKYATPISWEIIIEETSEQVFHIDRFEARKHGYF